MYYSITKLFSAKRLKIVDSPKILPAKLSRYAVAIRAIFNPKSSLHNGYSNSYSYMLRFVQRKFEPA